MFSKLARSYREAVAEKTIDEDADMDVEPKIDPVGSRTSDAVPAIEV
jgi:hypothetical protein